MNKYGGKDSIRLASLMFIAPHPLYLPALKRRGRILLYKIVATGKWIKNNTTTTGYLSISQGHPDGRSRFPQKLFIERYYGHLTHYIAV